MHEVIPAFQNVIKKQLEHCQYSAIFVHFLYLLYCV